MVSIRKTSDVYFFTATNLKWIKLLEDDEHKNIVINSLQFLNDNKRVKVLGFVILAIAGVISPAKALAYYLHL